MQFQAEFLLLAASLAGALAVPSPQLESNATESTQALAGGKQQYCNLNVHYCGWKLINNFNEDYHTRISKKLCQIIGDCNYWSGNIWNSAWNCGADLEYLGICGGANSCQDGFGGNDYCRA